VFFVRFIRRQDILALMGSLIVDVDYWQQVDRVYLHIFQRAILLHAHTFHDGFSNTWSDGEADESMMLAPSDKRFIPQPETEMNRRR